MLVQYIYYLSKKGGFLAGKTVLNKYSMFVSEMHHYIRNRSAVDLDPSMKKKASLIASFSSSHSWKTYEYLSGKGPFDKDAILEEKKHAFEKGWTDINESDIEEVMQLDISDYAVSMWLFYTLEKDTRGEYRDLFSQICKEFAYGLEPIERVMD